MKQIKALVIDSFGFENNTKNKTITEIINNIVKTLNPHKGRTYHNGNHVLNIVEAWKKYKKSNPQILSQYDRIVNISALLHDYVYEFGNKQNEYLSMVFAMNLFKILEIELGNEIMIRSYEQLKIQNCIIETAHHFNNLHLDKDPLNNNSIELIFRDLDLAGFALEYNDFIDNSINVAKENPNFISYDEISPEIRNNAISFYKMVLDLNNIYLTDTGRLLWEKQARENIIRFLKEYLNYAY